MSPPPAKPKLTLRQIDVFRSIMITGALNAAARELNISQPSLSRMVKRLEDVAGFSLFDRVRGRLVPTPEARELFASVLHIQEQLNGLSDVLVAIRSGNPNRFKFGASPSLGRRLVPRALVDVRARYPGAAIHLDTLPLASVADYLALGLGECFLSIAPIVHPMVDSRPIGEGRLVCLVPRRHTLATKLRVAVRDLEKVPMITFEPNTPHGRMIEAILPARSVTSQLCVKVAETAVGLASVGLGIAILDEFTALGAEGPDLVIRPIDLPPQFNVHLSRNNQKIASRFAQALEKAVVTRLRGKG